MKVLAAGKDAAARRGFTLVEMMVVLGVFAALISLTVLALTDATRRARLSGAKFTVISTLNAARQRAMARGADVYVIFSNLDSTERWPPSDAARVIVYEDPTLALRGAANLMTVVNDAANRRNVREEFTAAGDTFGSSGFAFVNLGSTSAVGGCTAQEMARLPPYMSVSATRQASSGCDRSWCTFCRKQNGQCIGAVRFNADGQANLVTANAVGTGGLIKLVTPTDVSRSACIAIGEPSGVAIVL